VKGSRLANHRNSPSAIQIHSKEARSGKDKDCFRKFCGVFLPHLPPTSSTHLHVSAQKSYTLPIARIQEMASMQGYLEVDPLVRRLKSAGMINKFLQNICIAEGVSKAGVKAELQSRLIESTFISNLSSFLLGPRA
jgi:hypothetical protein